VGIAVKKPKHQIYLAQGKTAQTKLVKITIQPHKRQDRCLLERCFASNLQG
jgi:uncharacterized protein YggU (UPF0235/DUF167 family)